MIWMMLICCGLPFLFIFFLSRAEVSSFIGYIPLILIGIFLVVYCAMMMQKNVGRSVSENAPDYGRKNPLKEEKIENEKNERAGKSGGCCHE